MNAVHFFLNDDCFVNESISRLTTVEKSSISFRETELLKLWVEPFDVVAVEQLPRVNILWQNRTCSASYSLL